MGVRSRGSVIDIRAVLANYPHSLSSAGWCAFDGSGGFSGASIWRGRAIDGREFALKRHPQVADADQIRRGHRWMAMARQHGAVFVPEVHACLDGNTLALAGHCLWEITGWMPGAANFHDDPSDAKLFAGMEAIARLHGIWAQCHPPLEAICPAILRRRRALTDAENLLRDGKPRTGKFDRAWNLLQRHLPRMRLLLAPWLHRPVPVQPCVVDIWHDHLLFEADRVSGIIDFAAAKLDAPAVDLARLLGSLIPDERTRMTSALEKYSSVAPQPNRELVEILDQTGVFGAVTNWLIRLDTRDGSPDPRQLERMEVHVERLARM